MQPYKYKDWLWARAEIYNAIRGTDIDNIIIDSVDVELVIFYFIDKTSHISHVAGGVLRRVGPGGLEPDQLGAWTPGQTAALMLPHHQAGYHNFNTLQHCQLSVKPPGTFKSIVSEPLQRQNCCPFLA